MKTPIEDEWNDYRKTVIHKDAGEAQIAETKLAFFAGAASLFTAIMRCLSPGPDPSEDDIGAMVAITAELKRFAARSLGAVSVVIPSAIEALEAACAAQRHALVILRAAYRWGGEPLALTDEDREIVRNGDWFAHETLRRVIDPALVPDAGRAYLDVVKAAQAFIAADTASGHLDGGGRRAADARVKLRAALAALDGGGQ